MKYAVIESGAKQYRVAPGDVIDIELVPAQESLKLDKVLLLADNGEVKIGTPYLPEASVLAKVVDPLVKDDRVISFKYKNKTNYRKKIGHRQKYTRIRIEEIK